MVGNAHKLELPDIGRARAGQVRLRGLRLVHTHLKREPLTSDDLTDLALLRLDLVAAIGVLRRRACPGVLHCAHLVPANGDGAFWRTETLPSVHDGQPDLGGHPVRGARGRVRPRRARPRTVGRARARHPGGGVPRRARARAPRPRCRSCASWPAPPASRCSTRCCRCGARPTRATSSAAASSRTSNLRSMQLDGAPAHLRPRPHAVAGAAHRRGDQPQGPRPHPADPRHLRPARPERRRQAAGRAGAAQVPAAAAGRRATTRCRGWRAASAGAARRDQARDRPPPRARPHHRARAAHRAALGASASVRRAAAQRAASCRSSPSSATPTPASPRCSTP